MVSIIIPCYNCEATIVRAVNSVFEQSYKDWEIILVDNNSTDSTYLLLGELFKSHPNRIKVLQERKKGACSARNLGLRVAQGEWIQFLDADDELLPQKLEQNMTMVLDEKVDVLAGSFFLKKEGTVNESNLIVKRVNPFNSLWKSFVTSHLGVTSANLWRKNKIDEVGGWDENLTSSQEYDLVFRMLEKGAKIGFIPDPLAILYIGEESISRSSDKNKIKRNLQNFISLRIRVKEYLKIQGILNEELELFIDTFLYRHLMSRKRSAPKEVDELIYSSKLKVPFFVRLGMSGKYILKSILKKN